MPLPPLLLLLLLLLLVTVLYVRGCEAEVRAQQQRHAAEAEECTGGVSELAGGGEPKGVIRGRTIALYASEI